MYDTYNFFNINKDKARCPPAPVMNKTPTESFLTYSMSNKIPLISHSAISNNKNYNRDRRKGDRMMIKGKNKNHKLTKENKKSWKKSKDLTKNFLQLKNKSHYIAIKKGNTKEPKKFPFQIPNLQVSRESKLYRLFF